jgi:hypothetical protein
LRDLAAFVRNKLEETPKAGENYKDSEFVCQKSKAKAKLSFNTNLELQKQSHEKWNENLVRIEKSRNTNS